MATDAIALGATITDDGIRAVNFFNGRLLTGRDLGREQEARRTADRRLGEAGGAGIAWGLEVTREGAAGELNVKPGLAVSASGQTLWLANAKRVTLVQPPEANTAAGSGSGFAPCGVLAGGTYYVAGAGVFLLTLAPASQPDGKAPVLALEAANTRCAFDATVEAVQLRLLRINDFSATGTGPEALARLRNRIAYVGFGQPSLGDAHARPGTASGPDLVGALASQGLSKCDVPLAVVYMVGGAVIFVDAWSVRRRAAAGLANGDAADWLGERRVALGEAMFAQFLQHTRDTPELLKHPAAAHLDWLPPAGLIVDGSVDWRHFFGPQAPAREVPLAGGDAPGVLARALADDPVRVGSGVRFRVWRIGGGGTGNPGALLFARDGRNTGHAEQVWFDGTRAALPGADDVQEAIEMLRDGSCLRVAVRRGTSLEAIQSRIKAFAGANAKSLHLCFEPGLHKLASALRIGGLDHVEVCGPGATLVNAGPGDLVLGIGGCQSVHVHDIALIAAVPGSGADKAGLGTGGALTVTDTPEVCVERVQAQCADAPEGSKTAGAAGIVIGSFEEFTGIAASVQARVADCTVSAGAGQVGIQAIAVAGAAISGNRVTSGGKAGRPLLYGIVVAGRRAGFVRIEGNQVEGAVGGIKVAVSEDGEKDDPALLAERVIVERNRIGLARTTLKVQRFGVFVGNAHSLRVCGNQIDAQLKEGEKLEASGVRLVGAYGGHLIVDDNLMAGTGSGVYFEPTEPAPRVQLWACRGNVLLLDGKTPAFTMKGDAPVVEAHNRPPVTGD
jgi:hypothetical protein